MITRDGLPPGPTHPPAPRSGSPNPSTPRDLARRHRHSLLADSAAHPGDSLVLREIQTSLPSTSSPSRRAAGQSDGRRRQRLANPGVQTEAELLTVLLESDPVVGRRPSSMSVAEASLSPRSGRPSTESRLPRSATRPTSRSRHLAGPTDLALPKPPAVRQLTVEAGSLARPDQSEDGRSLRPSDAVSGRPVSTTPRTTKIARDHPPVGSQRPTAYRSPPNIQSTASDDLMTKSLTLQAISMSSG